MFPKIRKSRKYFLFGENGYRVTYKIYGFCAGDKFPSCAYRTIWVENEQKAQDVRNEPKPPNRITIDMEEILRIANPKALAEHDELWENYHAELDKHNKLIEKAKRG